MILLIVIMLSITLLNAGDLFKHYQEYSEEPNNENFLKAVNFYNSNIENDEEADTNRLILSYVYLTALENNIDYFQTNSDELNKGTKFQFANNVLLSMGKYEAAIEIYESLNETLPQWSCPFRHKGEAYFYLGDFENAEIALKKAIETRIEHYDAYIWLAEVQIELEKYKEALDTFELGIFYKGKDSEDPEEEISNEDEEFLKFKLLFYNKKYKEAKLQREKLVYHFPDSEHWQLLEEMPNTGASDL